MVMIADLDWKELETLACLEKIGLGFGDVVTRVEGGLEFGIDQ